MPSPQNPAVLEVHQKPEPDKAQAHLMSLMAVVRAAQGGRHQTSASKCAGTLTPRISLGWRDAQWGRPLVALGEDRGSVPSTHIRGAHSCL